MPGSNVRSRNGCYRCRARKTKCDEARPGCARCESAGFACPGYKSPNEVVFRSMNRKIENKVAWTQGKRETGSEASLPQSSKAAAAQPPGTSRLRPRESSSDERDVTGKSVVQQGLAARRGPVVLGKRHDGAPLCVPMSTDWAGSALCRFFSDYVVEADEVKASPGYLNNLQKLYGEGNDDIVTHSVSAVSIASFSNQVRSEDLLVAGRKQYGKALLLVTKALSDPKQITKDGTFAGVFFLNMYEMISGDKPMLNQWGTHADALSMLLRLRGTSDPYTSERIGGVVHSAHGVIVFKNLLRRIPPGPESEFWAQSVDHDEPWAQVGLATTRISKLIPMADAIMAERATADANGHRLLQMISKFEAEDRSFEHWAAAAVTPYTYGTIDRQTLLAQGNGAKIPLPDAVHYYHDSWIAGFWNVYRFARIVLMQTLARLAMRVSLYPELAAMTPRMDGIREKVARDVDAMISDIFASIPYTLGKVDKGGWVVKSPKKSLSNKAISGYTSVWPLRLATTMGGTLTDSQQRYIVDQLAYIEGTMGIKQAKPNV